MSKARVAQKVVLYKWSFDSVVDRVIFEGGGGGGGVPDLLCCWGATFKFWEDKGFLIYRGSL